MSTTLPHGIIQINEGNIAWYGDITANWQLIDSKIGIYDAAVAAIPAPANNGTLTINYGGTTIAMFGADDAGNVSADIPAPGDGTLTVTQGGSTLGSFSANQATPETIDIPALGNGTITVTYGGSTLGTFTTNQAANGSISIPAPGVQMLQYLIFYHQRLGCMGNMLPIFHSFVHHLFSHLCNIYARCLKIPCCLM